MANLLDIRRRIKSVKNTQQITKAMKMVSAAKLKRAQNRVINARPFANKMTDVLTELAKHTPEDFHHPLLDQRGDERYLVVLITADKGLCGAFNTNLLKAAQAFLKENSGKQIEFLAIGRKGRDFFRRRATLAGEYVGLTGKGRVEFSEALEVARDIIARFTEEQEIDKVFLIFAEFKTVLTQRIVVEQLLPISRSGTDEGDADADINVTDYIYEQPPAEIFACRIEECRRPHLVADSEHESRAPGGDHSRNHRDCFRRCCLIIRYRTTSGSEWIKNSIHNLIERAFFKSSL